MGGGNYFLRLAGDAYLSTKSVECDFTDYDLSALVSVMHVIMHDKKAYGIAAPQVGANVRVIIISPPGKEPLLMINPSVIKKWGSRLIGEEECLSFPGVKKKILRNKYIKVSYQDVNGKRRQRKFNFYDARIVQHELDHLDGITLINNKED